MNPLTKINEYYRVTEVDDEGYVFTSVATGKDFRGDPKENAIIPTRGMVFQSTNIDGTGTLVAANVVVFLQVLKDVAKATEAIHAQAVEFFEQELLEAGLLTEPEKEEGPTDAGLPEGGCALCVALGEQGSDRVEPEAEQPFTPTPVAQTPMREMVALTVKFNALKEEWDEHSKRFEAGTWKVLIPADGEYSLLFKKYKKILKKGKKLGMEFPELVEGLNKYL